MLTPPDSCSIDPARLAEILERAKAAPCLSSLGLTLRALAPGSCIVHARRDPRFDGLLPGFHGGMQANVADCAAWLAIVAQTGPDEPLVTTDLSLHYLAPCLGDLVAKARVIKPGRTLVPVAVELLDESERLVATGIVTYIRLASLPQRAGERNQDP